MQVDLLITAVWVAYAVIFFGTIARRRVTHIYVANGFYGYVANGFYGGYILAIALLHTVNNLALPADLSKSYQVYTGAVDAMVQWWYGHHAVGFLLTAGFLGTSRRSKTVNPLSHYTDWSPRSPPGSASPAGMRGCRPSTSGHG